MAAAALPLIDLGIVLVSASVTAALTSKVIQTMISGIQKVLYSIEWDTNTINSHILGKKKVKENAPNCVPKCITDCALEGTIVENSEAIRSGVTTYEKEKICPHGVNWVVRLAAYDDKISIATGWLK